MKYKIFGYGRRPQDEGWQPLGDNVYVETEKDEMPNDAFARQYKLFVPYWLIEWVEVEE